MPTEVNDNNLTFVNLLQTPIDDTQWMEACNKLITQFAEGTIKPRKRKKRPPPDDSSQDDEPLISIKNQLNEEKLQKLQLSEQLETGAAEATSPLSVDEIKKEKSPDIEERCPSPEASSLPAVAEKLKNVRVKVEKLLDAEKPASPEPAKVVDKKTKDGAEKERKADKEAEKERKAEKDSEIRRPRSNVSTTRIRIQNQLVDSSDSEDGEPKKSATKKLKATTKPKVLAQMAKKLTKKAAKSKIAARKKLKLRRHFIRRRMETRKSKQDAMKSMRKSKCENVGVDDAQPIMTRKMTRRECQKEGQRTEESAKKSSPRASNKPKTVEEKKSKEKVEKREKSEPDKVAAEERPKKATKEEKIKKTEKPSPSSDKDARAPAAEDVTRRTLRSRNVIVTNDRLGKKRKKKALKNVKKRTRFQLRLRKELRNATTKKPTKIERKNEPKNEQKNESKEKPAAKVEAKPSWEEELFNYKASLRMPVQLINIARPNNWPKSSGGASSLPDLDRSETDSELLNNLGKQKTPKKKIKDETKVSNTKEFKDSVKILKEKFDKKMEEKNQASDLTRLMMEKKIKTIPKSSDGPELLPTPSLDGFRAKLNSRIDRLTKDDKKSKDSRKNDEEEDNDGVVEDSLIG